MDYSIWKLQKYGLSKNVVNTLSKQVNSIFDLIITNKKDELLQRSNRKNAVKKALGVLEKKPDFFDKHLFETPYILLGFDVPFNGLEKLIKAHSIKTINQLSMKSVKELDKNMFPSIKNTIKKAKKAAYDYKLAEKDNKTSVKTTILCNFFSMKKVLIKNSEDTLKVFPEKHLDRFNLNKDEVLGIIKELENNGYIHRYHSVYFFPSNYFYKSEFDSIWNIKKNKKQPLLKLEEFLKTNFTDKDILLERLKGKTLEEVGNEYGVSRERIRQRQKRVLNKMPEIYEVDKYKNLFEEYSFSKDEFTIIFNTDPNIYEFLKIVLKNGKKDTGEFILNSNKIPGSKKEKYLIKHKYFLTRFGEFKKISKQEFLEEVLYKYKDYNYDMDDWLKIYNMEARKYPYLNLETDNVRSLGGYASRSLFIINTYGRKIRYFDMTPSPDDDILKELINNFDDGCYSMNKIITDNKNIVKQLDIRDEYELHNFYKKRSKLLDSLGADVTLNRSPEFTVGDYTKKEFIEEYLIESSGQQLSTIVNELNEEYGLRKNTLSSYITSNFEELIVEGKIVNYNFEEYQNIAFDLGSKINEPVYLKSEVIKLLDKNDLKLNAVVLSKLGYSMVGNIIFKKEFKNVSQALSSIIGSENIWRRGTSPLEQSNEMSIHLSRLERNRDLVVLNENIYAKTAFLEQRGIKLSMIENYIESIYQFLSQKEYFSLKSLEIGDFDHPLIDFGFEAIFYERLIATSNLFNPINRSSPLLFAKGIETPVTLSKFFRSELENKFKGIDIYDFRDSIKERYNIEFDIYDIQHRCQQAGAFYSIELEKLYIDKKIYLDEVYS